MSARSVEFIEAKEGDVNISGQVPHFTAFNTWAGQGAPQPPDEAAGLRHFTIELPSERDLRETADRLRGDGLTVTEAPGGFFVRNPSANRIHLTVSDDVGLPWSGPRSDVGRDSYAESKQPKKEKTQSMRAITLESFDSSPALHEVPTPQIAPNEVLVRVHASSVNPVDGAIVAGMLKDMVEHEFPIVLGRDYAGVVEQAGSDVRGISVGDEVFGFIPGMSPTVHAGSWAELIAVPEWIVARKPTGVEFRAAGATPMAGITALSALDALGVSEGDTVLVVEANGGAGSFAVQLAANAGATVIAPALPEDEDYLRDLGVSEILPRGADIAAFVHERYPDGIEALLDLVSYAPEGFDTHAEVLKDDGRGASSLSAAGEGSGRHNVMAMPTQDNLERLGRMLEAGTLRVPIQNTYSLDQAGEALRALSTAHTQGKHTIQVA